MYNASVVHRTDITPDLMIIRVLPDSGVPSFVSGQYVALGLLGSAPRYAEAHPEKEPPAPDKILKRAYSVGSSPEEREGLEFYIAVVPDGALTSRLALLKAGDRLFAAPKIIGTFTLHDVTPDKNLVFVATGTGIAPFISMIRTPGTWTEGRHITIIHGVRYPQDFAYSEELEAMARNKPLTYLPIASRADATFTGRKGRVQTLFENEVKLTPERDNVFLCGNPAMIDDIERLLVGNGFVVHSKKTPGNLHLERYW